MAKLTALLALVALAVPSHAASPRIRRAINNVRANRVCAASTSKAVKNNAAQSRRAGIVTAFAVPVAVPVAPFASYWYGVSDYDYAPSLQGFASQSRRAGAPEAPSGETASDALSRVEHRETASDRLTRDAERRDEPFPRGAWERGMVAQHCSTCHGRTSPKQGLSLVDPSSLSAADRLRAIRAVVKGEMPPDTEQPLTDADRAEILRELTQ